MNIAANILRLQESISETLIRTGRTDEVTLIAVTKTHPVEVMEEALRAGIKHIGENKVQEARKKLPLLTVPYDSFHFIGHLQSNKINQLLDLKPTLIHSVHSLELAKRLHYALGRTNRTQDILIQINSSDEMSKSGFSFSEAAESIIRIAALSTLHIKGLMTIGMLGEKEISRPLFAKMKCLFEELKSLEIPGVEMKYLSMGMSDDYTIALEEGSNLLRIGTAIFGERNYGAGE
ncbi:MAG: YggS family pyridoxal phosphate-dependent enzyme [Candidatus Cloacimonas sp.]